MRLYSATTIKLSFYSTIKLGNLMSDAETIAGKNTEVTVDTVTQMIGYLKRDILGSTAEAWDMDFNYHARQFIDNSMNSIRTALRENLQKQGLTSPIVAELMRMSNIDPWKELVVHQIIPGIVESSYHCQLLQRYPDFFSHLLEFEIQSILTGSGKQFIPKRIHALLALRGHTPMLEGSPALIRIHEQHGEAGTSNKGRTPTVPQENMCLFVYNGVDIEAGLKKAWVSFDGKELKEVDIEHTRVRLLTRESAVANALANGIYSHKGTLIPVMGLQPFWQYEFVQKLEREKHIIATHTSQEVTEHIILLAKRFLKDEITPVEYWESLRDFPVEAVSTYLRSLDFTKVIGPREHQRSSPLLIVALEMMTIYPKTSI